MFTKICQSVRSLLKLEPKSPSLAGSARQPIQNLSQAQLGLESRLDFRAKLGSGSEGSGIAELGSAWARTYIKFRAGLELGLKK